jgi:predicted NACHT family NTPase
VTLKYEGALRIIRGYLPAATVWHGSATMDDLDLTKLATTFVQANIDRISGIVGMGAKAASNQARLRLAKTYTSYLDRTLKRYSKSKSFFIRSAPVPLYTFYVPMDLSAREQVLTTPGAQDIADVSPFALITGTGGSGKSLFMRHLLISSIQSQLKTPIFVELRSMNRTEVSVEDVLLAALNIGGLKVDSEYRRLALQNGHFCLLLDGFDELELGRRDVVAAEIQEITARYPDNWLIVSSRADPKLEGWPAFANFRLQSLTLDRAVELVQKLPFDDPMKDAFVRELRGGLYDRHRFFLSNPLLLSIMLLTYSDRADIPPKLSLFYGQAYESLFQKHDALKGGFQRDRRTRLDIEDFAKVFAAFCMLSYDRREFEFSSTTALAYLEKAQALSQVEFDRGDYLLDASQAVCLLIEEGLSITFAHRSFQEYFVARFIQNRSN